MLSCCRPCLTKHGVAMGLETNDLGILWIDDEPMILRAMARVMKSKFDIDITACPSGQVALEEFKKDTARFDLVVCDVQMPEMAGPSVVRAIRSLGYTGIIVFFSSGAGEFEQEVKDLISTGDVTLLLPKSASAAEIHNLALLGKKLCL
ncbi:MAG: hypothetical protein COU33_00520 [Candidatus Magasanikbacteria bacterium CG10_big_fil_rev_8_21_14_0_10_43_6]|uniref:Response regulatory domain-containing protein n=1 Tax=Candidatus Magasanikbacteria bacterium CG10_big_fil_rev_8_21_14_0_10_43_6 TaxID=1974650 RepID=A0A2M6W287_9BACT|nr:MAG: hypothetical protein COU33_00520 [Candidatus Magasanikbacteria bacterium CG10_big_fil_rev_8_21_14_0_10_43_6]